MVNNYFEICSSKEVVNEFNNPRGALTLRSFSLAIKKESAERIAEYLQLKGYILGTKNPPRLSRNGSLFLIC